MCRWEARSIAATQSRAAPRGVDRRDSRRPLRPGGCELCLIRGWPRDRPSVQSIPACSIAIHDPTLHRTNPQQDAARNRRPAALRHPQPTWFVAALLVCDHASRAFPARSHGSDCRSSRPGSTWRGTSALRSSPAGWPARWAPRCSRDTRLVVDCNRPPDDVEAFRTVSDGHEIPGNGALTVRSRATPGLCLRSLPRG